jgi:isocitrate lyase
LSIAIKETDMKTSADRRPGGACAAAIYDDWAENPRWRHVKRVYSAEVVVRLRGRARIEYTLAQRGAEKLWRLLKETPFVHSLGAMSGNQAMQQVRAGLPAIYLSGWQVAADANDAGQMYPDQSLYPVDSVPNVVRRITNALLRADQIDHAEGRSDTDWFAPVVADAESGFGGVLNAFELMKDMIEAGAAGVHFEDQLSSAKKCGHMGGKVLIPTQEAVQKLNAARLAADTLGVPTLLMARTDAEAATLLTSDIDENDRPFVTASSSRPGHRSPSSSPSSSPPRRTSATRWPTWATKRRRSRAPARANSSSARTSSRAPLQSAPTTTSSVPLSLNPVSSTR